jgi:lipopolysaccharide transport system permease protein
MPEVTLRDAVAPSNAASVERRGGGRRTPDRPLMRRRARATGPFAIAWRHRELIVAMLRRQLADRFSGSLAGWAWAIAAPLVTLAIYTVTFTGTLRLPLTSARGGTMNYALSTFAGLIIFNLCAELCYRAPLLLHEHASYIKTSIFPSETLAWIAVLRALTYAGISFVVLLVFSVAINRTLPPTVLLVPFLVAPLVFYLLGFVWCAAAFGSFTRDLAYLMATMVPVLMFATPVFYRLSDVPDSVRIFWYLNPIATAIEMMRDLVIGGMLPSVWLYAAFVVASVAVCRGGYAVFERYKGILVDVI